jgi:GPH family glycoside/pentoside/hexuronide:cation symporter
MMADVADEHELEAGRRQEGRFFGAVAFSCKSASGVGNIVAGVALDLIAWPRGQAIRSAADIAPETLIHLGIVYGPVVAGCAVVSVWCYTHYRLDRARHQAILEQLLARRRAAAHPGR